MKIQTKKAIIEYTTIEEIEFEIKKFSTIYKRLSLYNKKIFEKYLTLTFNSHKDFKNSICNDLGIKRWNR